MENCALCKKQSRLENSHFIPKFVFDWLKKSSATGYFRQVINPNLRKQDGPKGKFLCFECEQRFSRYEKYFSKEIFYPYVNKTKTAFEYGNNLKKFIISVSWRLLKRKLSDFKDHQPKMYNYSKEAENYWRDILLEDKEDTKYEHYLFLLDYIAKPPKGLSNKFQDYMIRAIDSTIVSSKKEVYLYSKFPSMFLISSIYPKKLNYWENSLVYKKGIIGNKPQISKNLNFGNFLLSRVDYIGKNMISKKQINKIINTMSKDLGRVKNSKSFELWLKKKKIPK